MDYILAGGTLGSLLYQLYLVRRRMREMANEDFESLLARRGEQMSLEICSDQQNLVNVYGFTNYLPLAIANALTWTGHAVRDETFYISAIDYLATGDLLALQRAESFSGRFGLEKLNEVLCGWKISLDKIGGAIPALYSCNAEGLYVIQQNCFSAISQLLDQRQIRGIGSVCSQRKWDNQGWEISDTL